MDDAAAGRAFVRGDNLVVAGHGRIDFSTELLGRQLARRGKGLGSVERSPRILEFCGISQPQRPARRDPRT
jgi:hypothetical protein